jgi:ABC-2 type transport system ATP-binding protein
VIIGPNGSGKSTFFRVLMDMLKPNKGRIEFFDQMLTEDDSKVKQQIGFVGERLSPFADLKIKEIASFISHWYLNWNDEYYKKLLTRYEIDEMISLQKCSKGTQKKVEFILALAHNPELLLLDEPSTGVDLISQRKMKEDLILFLEDSERSLLFSTHCLNAGKQLTDYICAMNDGEIVECIENDEIHQKWARLWLKKSVPVFGNSSKYT